MAPLLSDLEVLKPAGKKCAAFGSYGWGGGAVKRIHESMEQGKMDIVMEPLAVKWVPSDDELQRAFDYGQEFAKKVK